MTARILINHVKRATCAVYGVTTSELDMKDRHRRYAEPRQMAMAVAKAVTGQNWAQLARAFVRDEKTIAHASAVVAERIVSIAREFETYHEILRLAQCYAEGDYAAVATFSRGADLAIVPDAEIRGMRRNNASEWAISQRFGLPIKEVARVLGTA